MSESHQQVPRLVGRSFLAVTAALAVIGILLAVAIGVLHLAKWGVAGYSFEVITVSADETTVPVASPEVAYVQPWRTLVRPIEPLAGAMTMARVAMMAPNAVFIAGCIAVLILVRRLWVGKTFTRFAAWSLTALGVLVGGLGFLRPYLETTAIRMAVAELGLVTMPEPPPDHTPAVWVVPPVWDWTDSDWPMVVLGVVLVLLGWLLFRGLRLQRDLEGLV